MAAILERVRQAQKSARDVILEARHPEAPPQSGGLEGCGLK
jgi:hypothetical protein